VSFLPESDKLIRQKPQKDDKNRINAGNMFEIDKLLNKKQLGTIFAKL
jgi:Na+/alanine symporter